jgi:5-bromo-4-chloroindolyl phosphate hydrolysis protein
MGGEGTIAGMITSLRNNRMLLRTLRYRKKAAWEHLKDPTRAGRQKLFTKTLTDQERKIIREELKRERKKERIKQLIIGILMIALATAFFYFLLTWIG